MARNDAKKQVRVKKNPLKQRLEAVEKALTDTFDRLISDVSGLFANDRVLADSMDTIDMNTAALRALCVEKGVFTDEEFEAKKQEIIDIKARAQAKWEEEARKQAELEAQKKDAESQADDGSTVDPDLVRMKDAAERAGEDSAHPADAFIFGG